MTPAAGGTVPDTGPPGHIPAAPGLTGHYRRARHVVLTHTMVTDAVLALLVAVISTPWLVTTDPSLHSWILQGGLLVPLVWRRRHPIGVFAVVAAIALIQWFLGVELVADLSLLVALATLATYRRREIALTAAGLLEIGAGMAALRWSLAGSWLRSLVFLSGLIAAALLLGTNLRSRRALVAGLTQRAERLERERDQQAIIAAAAERTRIAREMHDVIGHSLAVMVSLADGAHAKLARDPERAATAIGNVSEVGRRALGETRRLLGVLRAGDPGDGLAPQPDLDRLPDLVGQVRAATGLDVGLRLDGAIADVSAGMGLTVYRIVQEALTNTVRHADGATAVTVAVGVGADGVDVEVTDDGPPATVAPGLRPSRLHRLRIPSATEDTVAAGHGLVGMRERAAVYGGTVHAGPGERGWSVRAHLVREDPAADEPAARPRLSPAARAVPPAAAPPAAAPAVEPAGAPADEWVR